MLHIHGLASVLIAGHRGNDLGRHRTGYLKALGRLNHLAVDGGAVIQHVLDINEAAVEDRLDEIVRIMKMEDSVVMGHGDMLRQKHASGHISGDLPCDIVPLGGGQPGVLVGILLRQLLVLIADQLQYGLVRSIGFAQQTPLITVDNVFLGKGVLVAAYQVLFHNVLHMLHGLQLFAFSMHRVQNLLYQTSVGPISFLHLIVCLLDGRLDLLLLKRNDMAVSFLNPHLLFLSLFLCLMSAKGRTASILRIRPFL